MFIDAVEAEILNQGNNGWDERFRVPAEANSENLIEAARAYKSFEDGLAKNCMAQKIIRH